MRWLLFLSVILVNSAARAQDCSGIKTFADSSSQVPGAIRHETPKGLLTCFKYLIPDSNSKITVYYFLSFDFNKDSGLNTQHSNIRLLLENGTELQYSAFISCMEVITDSGTISPMQRCLSGILISEADAQILSMEPVFGFQADEYKSALTAQESLNFRRYMRCLLDLK